ncbi:hypothetical protein HYH03_006659 [Edaphochlamys debaryana]|uniref:Uncharacterized protein n=1 Tax=Edaphochlamys debaryana TaxID=47281 RepID=A0A835Y2M9_9CHLO|nr:hypothetical protein HYH03_006659 [Edaphochlamys debaryana]|eukprot:KAG2495392.1 hypothetical protein HYH03_006659 [Edaphochlamys debaryana]
MDRSCTEEGGGSVRLVGAYVRAGCVELLMVLEAEQAADNQGADNASDSSREWRLPPWDEVLEALGLQPPEGGAGGGEGARGPALHMAQLPLAAPRSGAGSAQEAPTVLRLTPRVLLLPSAAGPGAGGATLEAEVRLPAGAELEVLVRAGNEYLPCRLQRLPLQGERGMDESAVLGGRGGAEVDAWAYALQLPRLPEAPGTLLVEFRCSGCPPGCPRALLPVLLTDDAALASELSSCGLLADPDCFDLLMDLGTLAAAAGARLPGDQRVAASVGPALAEFLGAAGLQAAEAHVRRAMAALQRPADAQAGASTSGSSAAAAATCAAGPMSSGDVEETPRADQRAAAAAQGRAQAEERPLLSVLPRVMGLEAVPAAQVPLLRAEKRAWILSQAVPFQAVEGMAFLVMACRAAAHGDVTSAGSVVAVGVGLGFVTLCAWLLLPGPRWAALVVRVHPLRYAGHIVAKAMVAVAGFHSPPGIASYVSGAGGVLLEGIIIPGCILVSWPAAMVVSALKMVSNAVMMINHFNKPAWIAWACAARIEALALATCLVCNAYLHMRVAREAAARERSGGSALLAARGPSGSKKVD